LAVDDIEANREGRLSEGQAGDMRRVERASAAVGVAALVAAAGFAGAALLVQGRGPVFYLLGLVALIFLCGGAAAFWNYSVVRRDREFEMLETFEGTVEAAGQRWRLGEVVVGGGGVEAGGRYRVWFLRGSHRLLSAEPLAGNPGRAPKVR
jgi:hypothetical protein